MTEMRLRRTSVWWILACIAITSSGCTERQPWLSSHVVVIGVDGLSPDGIRNAATPHIDRLISTGASTFRARGVLPTVSSPNWASMINGAGPEQHGILSNAWRPDEYSISPTAQGLGSIFPSVFDLIAEASPRAVTASVYDWSGFGRLYNREAVTIDIDAAGPQATADSAAAVIKAKRPVFTFVHLDHVDHALHGHGHGTPAYYEAVSDADRLIGQVVASLDAVGIRDRTTVIVTSDHGGVGTGHGGESMAELEIPWIIQGPDIADSTTIATPVDTYDTAATVAAILGLDPPAAWIGRPVWEALENLAPPTPPVLTAVDIAHVVVVGVDALSPDGVHKAHSPVLKELIANGAYSFTARGVLTTSSSQNWASMIMGAGPEQHGITSNSWEPDSFSIAPTDQGPEALFPSIFSVLREAEPDARIVSIYDWGGFGRLFPNSVVDVSIDADSPEDAVAKARVQFLEEAPRLTFIHLDHVDYAGHIYGHGTDEFYASVTRADRLIGEVIEGLQEAGMADETLLIISSDHGGRGKGHGGASMQEIVIPWIAQGPGIIAGNNLTVPIDTYDTAATVLFALGIPQPQAWIGRPVVSAFSEFGGSEPNLRVYVPAPRIEPLASNALRMESPELTLSVDDPKAAIHYTVDGSTPTAASPMYSGGFQVEGNVLVQAVAVLDGHSSDVSEAKYRVIAPGATKNVTYAYYEGVWEVLPDFDSLVPVHTGHAYEIHLEGVENRREDHFGLVYYGRIRIETPGAYTFYSLSDDGTKVYVNGNEVVNNDGSHGALERSGRIELTPGVAEIKVEYFEDVGGEHLEIFYRGPGAARKLLSFESFIDEE